MKTLKLNNNSKDIEIEFSAWNKAKLTVETMTGYAMLNIEYLEQNEYFSTSYLKNGNKKIKGIKFSNENFVIIKETIKELKDIEIVKIKSFFKQDDLIIECLQFEYYYVNGTGKNELNGDLYVKYQPTFITENKKFFVETNRKSLANNVTAIYYKIVK